MRLLGGVLVTTAMWMSSMVCLAQEPSTPSGPEWTAALERARDAALPVLVYSRPDDCSKTDLCVAFERVLDHPAIARRLGRTVFFTTAGADERVALTVYDPAGRRCIQWLGSPTAAAFRRMLNLVDGAAGHILAGYRAVRDGRPEIAEQEKALSSLALGNERLGTHELKQLLQSEHQESRELASVWIARYASQSEGTVPNEAMLTELGYRGGTDRVKFEAWMTLAAIHGNTGFRDAAIEDYRRAIDLVPDPSPERDVATSLLQRVVDAAVPLAGLGAPGAVVAGRRTVTPLWRESGIAKVEYRLDGRLVGTGRSAPFAAAIDFGRIPTRRTLEVAGLDAEGRSVRSASIVVNERTNAFSVRIVEPSSSRLSGEVDVDVAIQVPAGRTVRLATIEWNGRLVARLKTPPWRGRARVVPGELGILRASARLDDGTEHEDVRLVNAGDAVYEGQVHLVELPVYSRNRTLSAADLTLKEDGKERAVDRVITAADTPLVVALVLDVSTSMEDHVLDLEEAAIRFVESLDERDRVMVVAFDSVARVRLWPTGDREQITRAIQGLTVRGETALNDAMIHALLQLQSIGSRRAMVVMSDGWDNASTFAQRDVEEVAKRSAVPIYVVTMNPGWDRPPTATSMPVRSQYVSVQKRFGGLGRTSGGASYNLWSLKRLGSYWEKIADDLRDQSLLIYSPSPEGPSWRSLEVSLRKGGRLRAPAGVFVEPDGSSDGAK